MSRPHPLRATAGAVVAACLFLHVLLTSTFADSDDQPSSTAADSSGSVDANQQPTTDNEPQTRSDLSVPWKKGAKPTVARAPFRTAYDALTNVMAESELQYMFDQASFDPADPALVKIMYRYPLLGLDNIERFAKENRNVGLSEVTESPESYFGKVLHLRGRVKRVRRTDLLDRVAEGYDFDHFYLVEMVVDDSLSPVLICARQVPNAWPRDREMDELASCDAMLIQTNDLEDGAQQLVMTAGRVAWHPDRENEKAGVGESQLLLSKLGMDFGLFDEVRGKNGRESIESESFYQLMAALSRTSNDELRKHTDKFDLTQLLGDPKSQHGNLIMVEGSARRIQKIDISGSYYDKRLGIDHYYEVHVFIPLDRPVKLSHASGEPITYRRNFPVTVAVLRLPDGLGEGESMNQRVRIPSVYFKLWAYKSQYVSQYNPDQNQLSPLLLGIEPEIVETDTAINPYVAAAALGLFVLVLGGLWIALWRTNRKDDEFERKQVERQFEVEKGKSLNTMGIQSEDGPDFSKLD